MPVKQFWSLIVYDYATWAFIYNPMDRVGLSTYDTAGVKKKADGSVRIYFGPKDPEGLEPKWVPTQGQKPLPPLRVYCGGGGVCGGHVHPPPCLPGADEV